MFGRIAGFSAVPALGAYRAHSIDLNRALERLATGKQLNRASDNPAGMVSAESISAELKKLESLVDRSTRELGYLSAKDGAYGAVGDLLVELEGLVVSAANRGAMSDEEIEALQLQADSIVATVNHLAGTQEFNGQKLLDEAHAYQLGHVTVVSQNEDGSTTSRKATLADIANGGSLNLRTGDLEKAQEAIKSAISGVASTRGAIGARSKDVESTIRVSASEIENLTSARSQIVDADYAVEISNLVRAQTLQQASLYMMQVMMQSGERVLGLLTGSTGAMRP
ncbi:MAG: hypothetical protein AMXMBFR58_21340 [Phycisphaerae bacterium]